MLENKSEKLTINISVVDLGKIDYLVESGFYGNRTDFLRSAVKQQLDKHEPWFNREFIAKTIEIGIIHITPEDLKNKKTRDCVVVGKLVIDAEISLKELQKVYRKIRVFGKAECRQDIKKYYHL